MDKKPPVKITQKIVSQRVVTPEMKEEEEKQVILEQEIREKLEPELRANIERELRTLIEQELRESMGIHKCVSQTMSEDIKRPEVLVGSTYKIKQPGADHAVYVTINDFVLNEGTVNECRHPYEIFLNSKSMENFQWVLALTRVISAVFRKGGDVEFLVDELQSIFDPRGGYFKKGKMIPSLVAEIGDVVERHLIKIGKIQREGMGEDTKLFLAKKRMEFEALHDPDVPAIESAEYPAQSIVCYKCKVKAMIQMDGCLTCLACGESKCG